MHFAYRFCDGNANAAVEEYRRRYPERTIPSIGVRGLLEKYPTFGREKETGLLGALDT